MHASNSAGGRAGWPGWCGSTVLDGRCRPSSGGGSGMTFDTRPTCFGRGRCGSRRRAARRPPRRRTCPSVRPSTRRTTSPTQAALGERVVPSRPVPGSRHGSCPASREVHFSRSATSTAVIGSWPADTPEVWASRCRTFDVRLAVGGELRPVAGDGRVHLELPASSSMSAQRFVIVLVSGADGLFYCFGCDKRGDVMTPSCVRWSTSTSSRPSSCLVAALAGSCCATRRRARGRTAKGEAAPLVEAMAKAVDWYHQRLLTESRCRPGRAPDLRDPRFRRGPGGGPFQLGWAPDARITLAQRLELADGRVQGDRARIRQQCGTNAGLLPGAGGLFPISTSRAAIPWPSAAASSRAPTVPST